MIELDVSKSKDGEFFVFRPGKEFPHIKTRKQISDLNLKEVGKLRFYNFDDAET